MSDLTNVTIDSTSVSFDTVSDVDDEFRELVYGIFENLQGESKRLGQLRDEQQTNRELNHPPRPPPEPDVGHNPAHVLPVLQYRAR